MTDIFRVREHPQLKNPTLIVGWQEGAGRVSSRVIDYLQGKMQAKYFCRIEPTSFYALDGVSVEQDVAQFPESSFSCHTESDLVLFKGHQPQFNRYRFLNAVLDVAQHHCQLKELLTIGGIISAVAHTNRRRIAVVYNRQSLGRNSLLSCRWGRFFGHPASRVFPGSLSSAES